MLRHIPMYLSALGNEPCTTTTGVYHSLEMAGDQERGGAQRTLLTPVQLQRKLQQNKLEAAFSHKPPKHLDSQISSGGGERRRKHFMWVHAYASLWKRFQERVFFFFNVVKPCFHDLTDRFEDRKSIQNQVQSRKWNGIFFWKWKVKG